MKTKTVILRLTTKEAKHLKDLAEQELAGLERVDKECCNKEEEQLNSIANKIYKALHKK